MGSLHHNDGDSKGALCLHTVATIELVLDNVAVLGNVPWHALVLVVWVNGIWRSLHVDTIAPENEERDMQQEREDWKEDFEQPHGEFDEPEECAYNANHEMELSVAVFG